MYKRNTRKTNTQYYNYNIKPIKSYFFLRFPIKVKFSILSRRSFHFMPIGVPKVPFRNPGDEDASWVDI